MNTLKIAILQLNFTVGDISENTQRIIDAAHNSEADLLVFPELCLTGYPPEDLLFRDELYQRVASALEQLLECSKNSPALLIGYPEKVGNAIYNKAAVLSEGKILASYAKQKLPNYTVFDEQRYFTPGNNSTVFSFKDISIALLICEDCWQAGPLESAVASGANLILSINASPFALEQQAARETLITQQARLLHVPIVYANLVGAQDELVFDGGSFVVNADGNIAQQAEFFTEATLVTHFDDASHHFESTPIAKALSRSEKMYKALVIGLKDYVRKNNFKKVILGLSGGIDSALSLAIAVDALGAEHVEAVLMPSRHTADMSNEDAIAEAKNLKVPYRIISIEEPYKAFLESLSNDFKGCTPDTTEQNLQARCRGTILMALSNKFGALVLTTSNKSEASVGYSTLYGDMAGGFCVLKDVLKTDVYRLATYRNSISAVIPERVITRAPSAELADNQVDQDNLPPYELLDEIIKLAVEQDQDAAAIIARGFDSPMVHDVLRKIKLNEYKRRQAPLGVRLTERAFGRDRRYPITSRY